MPRRLRQRTFPTGGGTNVRTGPRGSCRSDAGTADAGATTIAAVRRSRRNRSICCRSCRRWSWLCCSTSLGCRLQRCLAVLLLLLMLLLLLLLKKKKQTKRTPRQQRPVATRIGCSDGGGDVDSAVAAVVVGIDRMAESCCHCRPVGAAFGASGNGTVDLRHRRCFRSGREDPFLRRGQRSRWWPPRTESSDGAVEVVVERKDGFADFAVAAAGGTPGGTERLRPPPNLG